MPILQLRIVTRKSPLALWQANHVRDRLMALHGDLKIQLIGLQTQGDKLLDTPLARIGGKGLFVKELELALLEGRADIAVHSMKDVTLDLPDGLALPVMLQREDPRDAFISTRFDGLSALPAAGRIGTSSLRRQCQLSALRPDLRITSLRGNVGTRLRRLDEGRYDAIILAAAGVKRLGLEERITCLLEPQTMLPAIGQGAIGIECRADDPPIFDLIKSLNHADTATRICAERAVNKRLFGGCQVPIAGFAELDLDQLRLRALVGRVDGSQTIRGEITGNRLEAEELGLKLAEDLLSRGADKILAELHAEHDTAR